MDASSDDPVVSLEDIGAVRSVLFRRWIPHFARLGLKVLAIGTIGGVVLYLVLQWAHPQLSQATAATIAALATVVMGLVPLAMHVWSGVKVDLQLSRRLDEMARRVRAGETVRASELRL